MQRAIINGFQARYLFVRNGWFQYRRSVPPFLRNLAGRSEFKESLHTTDPSVAVVRYGDIHAKHEAIFDRLRNGVPYDPDDVPAVEQLKSTAASMGISYMPAKELVRRDDTSAFAERFAKWDAMGRPEGTAFDALFGSQLDPIKLSDALSFYEDHIRDELFDLDKRTRDKKLNPKRSAINGLIDFLGEDADILSLDRPIALAYRGHLVDRIEDGQIIGSTANKNLGHIRQILNTNIKQRNLAIANPFSELRVKEDKSARPPFSVEFLRDHWLADTSVFDGLNDECRNLLFAMMDTGCGHRELCGLDPDTEIKLDHAVPHIIVRPNKFRNLKTDHRGREIPLVGYALRALQESPQGFPRYRRENGSEAASGLIMKFLREHQLLESDDHTGYSLRHAFKDRMRAHKFPPDLQNYLMGHKDASMGAHYGAGYSLREKLEYLKMLESDWN